MEALAVVLTELQRGNLTAEEMSMLSELLTRQGFTPQEITAAMDLLQRRPEAMARSIGTALPLRQPNPGAWRVLTKFERSMMTPEAEGLLQQMQRTSLVTPFDVDSILDEIAREETLPINRDDLLELMTEILLEKPQGELGE